MIANYLIDVLSQWVPQDEKIDVGGEVMRRLYFVIWLVADALGNSRGKQTEEDKNTEMIGYPKPKNRSALKATNPELLTNL